jgi:hypothetical protein
MALADLLLTIISSAIVSSMLAGLVLWLTKAWIGERLKNAIKAEYDSKLETHKALLKAEYDKQLETHKAQLKSQADVELEKLKSSLAIAATEQNTTFARLHDRRVDVIAKTYAGLRKLHVCVLNYVKIFEASGERSRKERRDDAVKASEEFGPYFLQNQIFLPKRIAVLIENANLELIKITNRFTFSVDIPQQPNVDEWIKLTEKLEKEFKLALEGLEVELRGALGDKT